MTAILQHQQKQPGLSQQHHRCVKHSVNAAHSRTHHLNSTHTRLKLSVSSHRREALMALVSLPSWAVAGSPAAAAAAAAVAAAQERDPMFYATWQYATPADILPYIQQQAAPGDAQAVPDAMDTFSQYYPQYKIGPEKGQLFEGVLQQLKPTWALEVGTFLGYSAIRTARNLQPGGKLLCLEANPQNAAVARQVVQYAGYEQQVQVIDGLSNQVIPQLPALLAALQQQQQQQTQQHALDCVFLDHCKDCYLPDLQSLEQLGLIQQGTTVMADNVIYPGAPGFLEFLESSGRYKTELLRARYEYEQAWNPDWEPNKEDALSVSVCSSMAEEGAALL